MPYLVSTLSYLFVPVLVVFHLYYLWNSEEAEHGFRKLIKQFEEVKTNKISVVEEV